MKRSARGWLLDTNVVSELRKGTSAHPRVWSWAERIAPAACFLSVVTVAEIRFGVMQVADPAFRAELETWLRDGVRVWFGDRILQVDDDVLVTWRTLAAAGQKIGYTYAQPDALIAATALVHELGVVTRNTRDFAHANVRLANPWEDETQAVL